MFHSKRKLLTYKYQNTNILLYLIYLKTTGVGGPRGHDIHPVLRHGRPQNRFYPNREANPHGPRQ